MKTDALNAALRVLIGLRDLYQVCHWNAPGVTRYQEHLLFERLYEQTAEDVDKLAERTVGRSGERLNPRVFGALAEARLPWPPRRRDLVDATRAAIDELTRAGSSLAKAAKMTPGTEDLLQGICSNLEEALYLLTGL